MAIKLHAGTTAYYNSTIDLSTFISDGVKLQRNINPGGTIAPLAPQVTAYGLVSVLIK